MYDTNLNGDTQILETGLWLDDDIPEPVEPWTLDDFSDVLPRTA